MLDDLLHHLFDQALGNREANTLRAAALGKNRAVDADQIAAGVDQCAAGVAGIDRRIGLDEILEGVDAQMRAAQGADDAHGHGLPDAEGVADGEHNVTHFHFIGVAKGDAGQVF